MRNQGWEFDSNLLLIPMRGNEYEDAAEYATRVALLIPMRGNEVYVMGPAPTMTLVVTDPHEG